MARFPKIDSPCPLDAESLKRIDGHCGHCDKAVHSLDGMSDAERAEFLRKASGPICVRYSKAVAKTARAGRFGLAIAATLITTTGFAQDAAPPLQQSPVPAASRPQAVKEATTLDRIQFVGGISDPADAAWTDEGSTPELPMSDPEAVTTPAPLDTIQLVGGGIQSPAEAQWEDDGDVPELPVADADAAALAGR